MYLDKEKILTSITKNDIVKICSHFGYPEHKQVGEGIGFNTALCHKGNSSYKLVVYPPNETINQYRCHCFTCGDSYDLVELVIRASRNQGKTLTWYKGLYNLAQITGHIIEAEAEETPAHKIDLSWLDKICAVKNRKNHSIPQTKPINENILECFSYDMQNLQQWLDEGISQEALNRYEIGFASWTNQITIPHRNWKNEELIGIRGRYVKDEDVEMYGKYIPMKIENTVLKHPLGNTLYGLWVVKEKIKRIHKIMLCEGEKSCLQAYTYFGEDSFVVSCCGSNITQTQIKIILQELQVTEVMVAFDREYEDPNGWDAELYLQKLIKKVKPLVLFCKVYLILDTKNRIPYKGSPTDCGKEVLMELMKEKILITTEMVKEYVRR